MTQLWLLSQLEPHFPIRLPSGEHERLKYVREVDQSIAKRHHAGLRYPSVLLVIALRKVLSGTPLNKAVNDALHDTTRDSGEEILGKQFEDMLRRTPPLRPGVQDGLRALCDAHIPILVATEGSVDRCRGRLKHWGLAHAVNHIMAATKSPEFFIRAAKLLKLLPRQCVVVGDQLDRDIMFGTLAGCTTVYFPGGFSPVWSPKVQEARPDYIVESFDQVLSILSKHVVKPLSTARSSRMNG
jgi:putative hydrolase of the HAD superfamily